MNPAAKVIVPDGSGGFAVTRAHLVVAAKAPGSSAAEFQHVAEATKVICATAKPLATYIMPDAKMAQDSTSRPSNAYRFVAAGPYV